MPYDVIPTVVITGAGVRDIELATRGVSIDSSACQSVLKEGQTIVDSRLQLALSFIKDAKEGRGARLHRRNVRAMAAYRIHNSLLIRAIVMLAAIALILVTPWEPISVRQVQLSLVAFHSITVFLIMVNKAPHSSFSLLSIGSTSTRRASDGLRSRILVDNCC